MHMRQSSSTSAGTTPPQAQGLYNVRWRILAVTFVGAFMSPLDGSIVSVALPKIGPALRLSFSESIWVQAAYLLALTIFLVPVGRLADAHGRIRFYLLGAALFGATSLLSALSPNATWLIVARALQGVSTAFLSSTSVALVTAAFPREERGRALGINVMAVYLGLSLGPLLGGIIVDHLGWKWIFLVNIPICLATISAGWGLLSAQETTEERGLDWLGTLLLAAGLSPLMIGLSFAPVWGWSSMQTLLPEIVGLGLLASFVFFEHHTATPLIDPELFFTNRLFAAANLAALLNYTAFFAATVLTAVFLEVTQHRSAQVAGLLLVSQPLVMSLLSPAAGRLSDRVGSLLLSSSGMVIIAAGMAALATVSDTAPPWRIAGTLALSGLGMAAFSSPNISAVMGSVDRSQLSLAASVQGTMRFLGQTLSLAFLGALAASRLGAEGGRVLFMGAAPASAAAAYAQGFRVAMLAGAAIALLGAAVCLVRGPSREVPHTGKT